MAHIDSPGQPDPSGSRLMWADSARGLSVLAVVLFHVGLWHFLPHRSELWNPAARVWLKVDDVLGSVRIPLLLAVSGLVLSRRVRLGFTDRSNVVRPISNYYLYVVWLVVYTMFFGVVDQPDLPHRVDGPHDLATQLLIPDTTLWYVFALALYVPILAVLRRVPPPIVLAALAVLTVGIRMTDGGVQAYKIGEVAFFFAVGVYGADCLRRLAAGTSWSKSLAWAVAAAVVTLGGKVLTGEIGGSVLFIVRGLTFMVASIVIIAYLVRWEPIGRVMSAVGRQTLPIYVIHPLMICSLIVLSSKWTGFDAFLARPAVSLLYPIVVTAGIAVLCLALHRIAQCARLGALFSMPAWARGRLGQAHPRASGHHVRD